MISVYILKSKKDKGYYIGISKNVINRLQKHNSGTVRSTKSRSPWELLHTEEYDNYSKAREREKELKSYKGGNKLKDLLKEI